MAKHGLRMFSQNGRDHAYGKELDMGRSLQKWRAKDREHSLNIQK